jgi:glycosyltransferase involved in cell wall biosynthesis
VQVKVLWITNIVFPEPSGVLGIAPPVTGGWMYGLAESIAAHPDISLAVATVYSGREFREINTATCDYFLLPASKGSGYPLQNERYWRQICAEWKPDLVHIHGTEYPHGLSCMRAQPSIPYLVSLQGITSACARYHFGGISCWTIARHLTFRDVVRRDSIFQSKRRREKNGVFEKECIQKAKVVLGRTNWDYVHAESINPNVEYRKCGECLRDGFYSCEKWDVRAKHDQRIFMSQAHTPLKGLHQVLQALALLKDEFPNFRLRIAGNNIVAASNFGERLRRTGYGLYVASLIRQLALENRVEFTGLLSEEEMLHEYRQAHVYLCPSAIENSPNSLAEAQMVGVPVIASRSGGIPDMIDDNSSGIMYRFEEYEELAYHIRRVFLDDGLSLFLSKNAIAAAEARHDRTRLLSEVRKIYQDLFAANS